MIFEMARIEIKAGKEAAFEQGVTKADPLFQRARGCHGLQLLKSIEHQSTYTLMVRWETVEDNMIHFRQSEDLQQWRSLVGEFFSSPPQVEHVQAATKGF